MNYTSKWTNLGKRDIYENSWIEVSEFEVKTPKGKHGIYGKVHYKKPTVGVVPILDGNRTILVGQDRFPTNSYSWEIPIGGAELNETCLVAAQRELMEETGFIADDWTELLRLETSNSVTDETATIFYCRETRLEKSFPDQTELLKLKILEFDKAFNMVMKGEIKDAISVAAILKMRILLLK